MQRLTQKDEQGNWCVKGLPWKAIYAGEVITENTEKRTYGAFFKLLKYEDTNRTPDQVQELSERDTAKRVELINNGEPVCPECGAKVFKHYAFCRDCGQRLKQED